MLRKIYYKVSPETRFFLRKLWYFPIDFYEGITGKREAGVPKKGDIFIGSGDFVTQGMEQLQLLKSYIDIQPDDKVLDIGSGIGRTALALSKFLDSKGSYHGFDAVKKGVDWCKKNISSRFKNFEFKYVPLRNNLYNKSAEDAANFRFPYEDEKFTKIFLFSVFTHMKMDEIQNYLNEINRVMQPDGKCLATFFTYSSTDQLENFPGFTFPTVRDGYRLEDENVEEANIALDIDVLTAMAAKAGLNIEKTKGGFWRDLKKQTGDRHFQDIIIFTKITK